MALASVMKFHPKLQDCLVNDRAHIGISTSRSSRVGTHVKLIQVALNRFARREGFDQIEENEVYDGSTANLVTIFKEQHRPPILNFAHAIDTFVGKKTIAALDKELPPFRGR